MHLAVNLSHNATDICAQHGRKRQLVLLLLSICIKVLGVGFRVYMYLNGYQAADGAPSARL
jgi:hypothetical protein